MSQSATLGAGCFWCVEAVFLQLRGVQRVESGYAGGAMENPSYQAICTGGTGHAEVIRIDFDPELVSYETLLEVFWHSHDPTTLNRQGADRGTQYRSVIFYHDEPQRATAEASKAAADTSALWPDPIVTEMAPLPAYFPAEAYHQDYYTLNPAQGYCSVIIPPKLKKLRERFPHLLV